MKKIGLLSILILTMVIAGCVTSTNSTPSTAVKTISSSINSLDALLGQALSPQKAAGIIQLYITLQGQHEQDIQKPGLTSQEISFLNAEGAAINQMLPYVSAYQKWVQNSYSGTMPTPEGDKAISSALQTILQLLTTLK